MDGYDIYSEVTSDGELPDYLFAVPHGEFVTQRRDPSYKPRTVTLSNPLKVDEEKEKAIALAAEKKEMFQIRIALCRWYQNSHWEVVPPTRLPYDPVRDAVQRPTTPPQKHHLSKESPERASSLRQDSPLQYHSPQDKTPPPLPSPGDKTQQLSAPNLSQLGATINARALNNGTPLLAMRLPAIYNMPPRLPSHPLLQIPGQSVLSKPPLNAPENPQPQAQYLPASEQAESWNRQSAPHTSTNKSTPTSTPRPLPRQAQEFLQQAGEINAESYFVNPNPPTNIPDEIQTLADQINALEKRGKTGLPMKKWLRAKVWRGHCDAKGVLRRNSPLFQYRGDERLLSKRIWVFLLSGEVEWAMREAAEEQGRSEQNGVSWS